MWDGTRFSPLAYLLSRLLQAVWGTLGIYLTYRVGRRMGAGLADPAVGRWVGLLAAVLVACAPWHVRQSAIAKPDALLFLLVVATVDLSLAAAARPRLGAYLAAGVAAGLAAASKYVGVVAGVPAAVAAFAGAALARGRRLPRGLAWLAAAGAAASLVFLALDVYLVLDPELVERNFGGTLRDYGRKGAAAAVTRLELLLHAPRSLVSATFLGPVFGALGLLGMALLPVAAARGGGGAAERAWRRGQVLVFLSFPLAYVAAYVTVTTNPSEHNWLPLLPFAAIGAAGVMVAAGRAAAARWPAVGRRAVVTAGVAVLVAASFGPAAAYTYRGAVPSTVDRAEDLLLTQLEDLPLRVVLVEPGGGERLIVRVTPLWKAVVVRSSALGSAPAAERAAADAQVHVRGPGVGLEDFLARRARRPYEAAFFLPARAFRARGRDLVVLVHPWRLVGEGLTAEWRDRAYRVPAEATAAGERVSWEVLVPRGASIAGLLPARADGEPIDLYWSRRQKRVDRYLSERVRPPAGAAEWSLSFVGPGAAAGTGAGDPPAVGVVAHRWAPPPSLADASAEP